MAKRYDFALAAASGDVPPLPAGGRKGYLVGMKVCTPFLLRATALAMGGIAASAAAGFAFAGWIEDGPAMFMALAQAGLSWCL